MSVPLLHEWFDGHGVVPVSPGNYFAGKGGGLLQAEARLTVLHAEMASAEALLTA